jgi:hypothetical protein
MRYLISHTDQKSHEKNPIFAVPQAGIHYLDQWNVSAASNYQGSGANHNQPLPSSFDGITGTFKQIEDVSLSSLMSRLCTQATSISAFSPNA